MSAPQYGRLAAYLKIVREEPWREHAACKGMNPRIFYPEKEGNDGHGLGAGRRICASCPVRQACSEAGMAEDHGLWGGLSVRERRTERYRSEAS